MVPFVFSDSAPPKPSMTKLPNTIPAASTIFRRFQGLYPGSRFPTPQAILYTPLPKLRSAGLSPQKASYILDLATKVSSGEVDLKALRSMRDDEVVEELTKVKGVGRWTAEMVLMFTWVHLLVFVGLGGIVARLVDHAERHPNVGFGVLLLFVVFQFGFIAAATIFAAPVLRVLSSWSILVANLLAAAAMTGYFRWRHPDLHVSP